MEDQGDRYKQLLFESVLTYSDTAFLLVSINSSHRQPVCLVANQAFYQLTGQNLVLSADRPVDFDRLLGLNSADADKLAESIHDRQSCRMAVSISRNELEPIWVDIQLTPLPVDKEHSLSTNPIHDTGQYQHYVLLTIRDNSDLKLLEGELEVSRKRTLEAEEVKDKFLSSMSHEFRTPMSGVLGMSELLSSTHLDEQQRGYIEAVISSAKSLVNILGDVIEYAKSESGHITILQESMDLPSVLSHINQTFQHRSEKRDIDFSFNVSPDVPKTVIGDKSRFSQVVMQLIGNAFKFTDTGFVRVTIEKGTEEHGLVWVNTTIEDSGIGIPEELRHSIFDSFSKASKSTMSSYGGTGLGLPIVKSLVGLMDGQIDVKSIENEGSRFSVRIPFRSVEYTEKQVNSESTKTEEAPTSKTETVTENTPAGDHEHLYGRTVLVVDDHPINRKLLEGMLSRAGISTISVDNGEDAVKAVTEQSVDLVLMDVHMPGMSGLEATRLIRSELPDDKNGVPVIAVSASVMESDIEACKSAGMNGFVSKPFTYDKLLETIGNHLIVDGQVDDGEDDRQSSALPAEGEEIVNFDALKEMTAGDKQMMIEMIELFLDQTPKLLSSMRRHFEVDNLEAMGKDAHTLKPTFYYIGIEYAIPLLLELELFKNPGSDTLDRSKIAQTIVNLEEIADKAYPVIRQELEKNLR